MIRQIKSLYVKTVARIIPAAGVGGKEIDARTLVRRRVEITVERESVSVFVPGRPQDSTDQTAVGRGNLKAQTPELPPAPDAAPKRLSATVGGKPHETEP
jgi:hypothetical protein